MPKLWAATLLAEIVSPWKMCPFLVIHIPQAIMKGKSLRSSCPRLVNQDFRVRSKEVPCHSESMGISSFAIVHTLMTNGHWRKRWSTISRCDLQRAQRPSPKNKRFCRLSQVGILFASKDKTKSFPFAGQYCFQIFRHHQRGSCCCRSAVNFK
jgi:hypothetical protein